MKHIFFVEDDLSLINGLSFAIQKQGYALTIARTIAEAEQLWANGNYCLLYTSRNGYTLLRKN